MNHRIFSARTALATLALASIGATTGCSAAPADASPESNEAAATPQASAPTSDPNATSATKTVLANLRAFEDSTAAQRQILLGQQEADVANTSTYGTTPLTSDMEKLTGKLPAIVSYDLSSAYPGSTTMFDPEGFRSGRQRLHDLIVDKHRKGILVSLVWHMRCPKAAPGDSDKYSPADCPSDYRMEELLAKKSDGTKGAHFDEWRAMLDEVAELLWSLKDDNGNLIPVQIRPFHEFTGDWFWWGRKNDPSAWQQAWRETVSYLRNGRGLHSPLWVFCADKPTDAWQVKDGGDFEKFYPGDAYVDVVGFDRYDFNDGNFAAGYQADLQKVADFAAAHGKVAAVTEVGINLKTVGVSANPTWFTKSMLAPLVDSDAGRAFAYVALWRNAPWEKYLPEPNDGAIAKDVQTMAADGVTVLAGDDGDLYSPVPASATSS